MIRFQQISHGNYSMAEPIHVDDLKHNLVLTVSTIVANVVIKLWCLKSIEYQFLIRQYIVQHRFIFHWKAYVCSCIIVGIIFSFYSDESIKLMIFTLVVKVELHNHTHINQSFNMNCFVEFDNLSSILINNQQYSQLVLNHAEETVNQISVLINLVVPVSLDLWSFNS